MGTLRKIIAQARLSTLLFVKDRMTVLVLFVSVLTFLFCMADFSRGAEELSAIPIGLFDSDISGK